ncbi:MAG: oligosaccharide flippase family protein [Bacteroidales bacterium]|nr:oligosaccharide flippase family protein [Bacteroidales bacterium]
MLQKIYSKHKSIIKNTGYLSILEFLKLAMPFIALPYIIRVIGLDNYGLVAFAQVIISYFIVIINFGLDISAVKLIAENRHNKSKLNEIVSSVLTIKSGLFLLSFGILIILLFFIDIFKDNKILFIFTFLTCLSEVVFPTWFYQGIEKMKYITIIRFSSILFYVLSIFLFLKRQDDYVLVPLFQSLGWLLSGVISFYTLIRIEKIKLHFPSWIKIKYYFLDSVPFFISRVSLAINSGMAKTVTGFCFSLSDVAIFDLAQKIANVAIMPMHMLCQAMYPHIAKTKDRKITRSYLFVVLGVAFCIIIGVYILAPYAIDYFTGGKMHEAVLILRLLCLYIFFGSISIYLGYPTLVSFGYPSPFNKSVLFSTIILFISYASLYLTNSFSIINFSLVLGLSELSISAYRMYYCNKYKIFGDHLFGKLHKSKDTDNLTN